MPSERPLIDYSTIVMTEPSLVDAVNRLLTDLDLNYPVHDCA